MNRVCILTDSSVQFTRPKKPADNCVFTIPLFNFPRNSSRHSTPEGEHPGSQNKDIGFESPGESEIKKEFDTLKRNYSDILVITISSALSGLFSRMEKTIKKYGDVDHIHAIDSRTTSVGLGLLVQKASDMIAQGVHPREIERNIRVAIPQVYTLFCLPDLAYLAAANFLSSPQAVVGEMLDLLPIFSLEDGCLNAVQKVRTQRHLLETLQEFVDEYSDPSHVAVIKNGSQLKTSVFRDYVTGNFPKAIFSEHTLGDPLVELLGPQSIGLIVMERQN